MPQTLEGWPVPLDPSLQDLFGLQEWICLAMALPQQLLQFRVSFFPDPVVGVTAFEADEESKELCLLVAKVLWMLLAFEAQSDRFKKCLGLKGTFAALYAAG